MRAVTGLDLPSTGKLASTADGKLAKTSTDPRC
jgi:hypothetical protein